MAVQVTINDISGQTPYDIYVCQVDGSGCFYISTITDSSFPYVFDIPAPNDTSANYMIKAIDANGCIISGTSSVSFFVTPTPTPWNYCYSFNGGFDDQPEIAIEDTSGRIIFGGLFTSYSGQAFNRIVRLNSDASTDNTFNIGTGFDNAVYALAIQNDGKILVGGDFTSYDGNSYNRIIRLNVDGSVDNTFNVGTGFDAVVWIITLQSDGKILVGGNFLFYNGNSHISLIRLNSDGSVDNSFNLGSSFNNAVFNILQQNDNKKLVLGAYTTFDGSTHNRLVRLNDDGTIDNTFNIGSGFNDQTLSGIIETDGKILITGLFDQFDGQTHRQIVRLNENGSVDNTFDAGPGFARNTGLSYVTTAIKYTDKYFLTGDFNFYSGISANGLIRLNYDGTKDETFNYGTGLDCCVSTFNTGYILSNGIHLSFGQFNSYNGYEVNDIVFLNPFGTLMNCLLPTPTPTITPTITPTPSST